MFRPRSRNQDVSVPDSADRGGEHFQDFPALSRPTLDQAHQALRLPLINPMSWRNHLVNLPDTCATFLVQEAESVEKFDLDFIHKSYPPLPGPGAQQPNVTTLSGPSQAPAAARVVVEPPTSAPRAQQVRIELVRLDLFMTRLW